MSANDNSANGDLERIPRLREPIVLYVDDSVESRQAETLLRSSGLEPFITEGQTEPLHRKPLLVFSGACYQGVPAITGLLHLIVHWRRRGIAQDLFADSSL